jgi:hypothetical protein
MDEHARRRVIVSHPREENGWVEHTADVLGCSAVSLSALEERTGTSRGTFFFVTRELLPMLPTPIPKRPVGEQNNSFVLHPNGTGACRISRRGLHTRDRKVGHTYNANVNTRAALFLCSMLETQGVNACTWHQRKSRSGLGRNKGDHGRCRP